MIVKRFHAPKALHCGIRVAAVTSIVQFLPSFLLAFCALLKAETVVLNSSMSTIVRGNQVSDSVALNQYLASVSL